MHRLRLFLLPILLTAAVVSIGGCKKKEKIELSGIHTTAPSETMAPETTAPDIVIETTSKVQTSSAAIRDSEDTAPSAGTSTSGAKNITTQLQVYTSGKVRIEYPSVSNLEDAKQAAAIDALLKKNALAILDAKEIQDTKDALTIQCNVLTADRNRITVTYQGSMTKDGAPYPVNLFYTNTVSVAGAENIGFQKYVDPYTMAGYVLSNDCTFFGASPELTPALLTAKNQRSLEDYTTLFQQADFTSSAFPESFSYEHEGSVYFSIPVSHALGDYVIVVYTFDTK